MNLSYSDLFMEVIISTPHHIYYCFHPLFIFLHPKFPLLVRILLPLILHLYKGLHKLLLHPTSAFVKKLWPLTWDTETMEAAGRRHRDRIRSDDPRLERSNGVLMSCKEGTSWSLVGCPTYTLLTIRSKAHDFR